MKTIALCFNTPGMEQDQWKNENYGKLYPGSGWMRHMRNAISGEEAIDAIRNGDLLTRDVIIVQEEDNYCGIDLQFIGCDPRVIMCLESPIFASSFYDQIKELSEPFRYRLFFSGGNEHLYFPSFDESEIRNYDERERKFLCMVTANKHYSMLDPELKESLSFQMALKTQLHDSRYQAIDHFIKSDDFDLMGRGWQHLGKEREIADKYSTLQDYRYCLCFENGAYPGYVTEKIIDSLVCGVIPIYLGAPDISKYVPQNLFIDARQFPTFYEMEKALRSNDFMHELHHARDWLRDGMGRQHENKFFAEKIMRMCD